MSSPSKDLTSSSSKDLTPSTKTDLVLRIAELEDEVLGVEKVQKRHRNTGLALAGSCAAFLTSGVLLGDPSLFLIAAVLVLLSFGPWTLYYFKGKEIKGLEAERELQSRLLPYV